MADPILATSDIPASLWEPGVDWGEQVPKGTLKLPDALSATFRAVLEEMGELERARDTENRDRGEIGGAEEGDGVDHFVSQFASSCGRAELFALDPHLAFKTPRDLLVKVLAGGRVAVLDLPVGAGAGAATFISIVQELRRTGVIPSPPLEIMIVGGELSRESRDIAAKVFGRLRERWLESGIDVSWELREWDVLSDESTEDLLEVWRDQLTGREGLLLWNNFSGFLGSKKNEGSQLWLEEAASPIRSLLAVTSRRKINSCWIEPATNNARKRFWPALDKIFASYRRVAPALEQRPQSTAQLRDPVAEGNHFAVRATGAHLVPTES